MSQTITVTIVVRCSNCKSTSSKQVTINVGDPYPSDETVDKCSSCPSDG